MEAKAYLKFTRISPKKVRLITSMIIKKKVDEAIDQLVVSTKKSAPIVLKVLKSAISNAKNEKKMNTDELIVSESFVNEGATLKRWRPRAFGRAAKIRKRTSKITIVVSDKSDKKEKPAVIEKKEKAHK
ncbi:MAG: 50S ribosomal protein L22 [Parcubacteria group bacterium CG1_02_41_12]|nr:MAG: 50S ribosomal protein L22 [Parcubacteria group bacterium CG1_02_41_12]PIQ79374.1 MAG: 50S ribosomal protein L22 [Parcubacteria group bacterium CG11_big_fil_rev_8_21_14_0_20_41_14]PIR56714.1 MAG: 50S ribosomal protein L22 [Parcubacteria group bacterium CG10_big_fil_rev_8_21_14_0_10_41_35]